jgi:predicted ATPase/class 3 adenylate cyclase
MGPADLVKPEDICCSGQHYRWSRFGAYTPTDMPVCGSCGRDNPEPARFCMSCASPLTPVLSLGMARKTVSIVFCDVVGSTPMGDELDPETVRRVMTRFFEEMRHVLERHGGTVEKYIGDAVMAVFGIPRVHEDDALRATRAAADMRSALTSLNDDLERTVGVSITTRTGVNTGEVFVSGSAAGPAVVGDTVNVAARLQQAAAPGEILLGHETYLLVRDSVSVDEASSLVLKGKRLPVTAYRLIDITLFGERPKRADPALVGRSGEIRQLRAAFDLAVTQRACRLLTVMGSAGAGKSRLATEFVASMEEEAVAVWGRCLPYGDGITFWPVAEAVRQLAGIDVDDPLETARSKLEVLLRGAEESGLLFDRVAAATGLADVTVGMQETFWAIRRLLEQVARERPLVVIFDDLQWAEPALLDLLDYLLRSCRDAPILVLCLARSDLLDERSEWAARLPNATMLHLPPLADNEIGLLIEELLQGDDLSGGLRERISQVGSGNPLFVVEMFKMLRDDGLLGAGGGDGRESSKEIALATVPPTIHALVGARLDRLTAEERAVIHGAAVIGKVFSWGAVLDLVPDDLRPRVGPLLQSLVRRELIAPDRSVSLGEDAFGFHHLLIQEAAYRQTPKELRADLHVRFAGWLERTTGDRIGENEEILAYHLEQAARYRMELGRSDDRTDALVDRASATLASVGRRALARGDISAAVNLLGRGYDLLTHEHPRRLELVPELGQVLMETGEIARAERMLTDAVERARVNGDRGLEAHVQIVLLLLKESTDPEHRSEEALETFGSVIPVLEELGDDLGLARAYRLLGDVHFARSSYANADRALEQAIDHARKAGAEYEEAESLRLYAGSGLYGPAPADEVMSRCEKIMEVAKGNPTAEAGAIRSMGALDAMRGRIDEGRELVRQSAQILEDHGLKMRATFVSEAEAFIETLAGDPAAAERALRAGYDEVSRLGDLGYQSTAAALLAHAICGQERYEEAEGFCRIAAEIGADDDLATQVLWRSAKAKVFAARGEHAEAAALARAAVELAEGTDDTNMCADSLMDLAGVLSAVGDSAESVDALRRARELYVQKGNLVSAGLAERLVAAGR